uniref:Uncharacterized protein n=1 Tax=Candidatus Kentrum sp. LPFa TaxID=2126335 RepID=A0A450WK13_9GAMM|nr:MAG: hypothetical protein BECKLPF1236A_GA0070988_101696 [Candidatus Kentron sp. LPFa]VFK31994.1 MAG: hypothetical protein BECKLPF1236C_GA0070990_101547 [Candidatus Kentron sp. LPFa]
MTKKSPFPSSEHSGSEFHERLLGKFSGILRWEQLDALWEQVLTRTQGWYVYEVGRTPPESPFEIEALQDIVSEIDEVLHNEHKHDYCGIVYTDDFTQPTLIKVYDPGNLGVVCGPGGAPILPRWILSRIKPRALIEETRETDHAWWKRILPIHRHLKTGTF